MYTQENMQNQESFFSLHGFPNKVAHMPKSGKIRF